MPRVTYDYIKNLTPSQLGKMSKSQLADLLRKIRVKTQTRIEQLNEVKNIYSPAVQNIEMYYLEVGRKNTPTSKMTRNQILNEIFVNQSFHQAETSTVKGARKVAREQDVRIFGATPTGRPKKRMTAEQRHKFWSIYEEFQRTYKSADYLFGSNRIQQYLGEMFIQGEVKSKNALDVDDLNFLLAKLQDSIEEKEDYEYDDANVFSGRGTY